MAFLFCRQTKCWFIVIMDNSYAGYAVINDRTTRLSCILHSQRVIFFVRSHFSWDRNCFPTFDNNFFFSLNDEYPATSFGFLLATVGVILFIQLWNFFYFHFSGQKIVGSCEISFLRYFGFIKSFSSSVDRNCTGLYETVCRILLMTF